MINAWNEDITTYRLILDIRCHIDLNGYLYVSECAINIVSVSGLDDLSFNIKIGYGVSTSYRNDYYYGNGTLFDSLNRYNLDAKFSESLFNIESRGVKRCSSSKSFAFLWH